MVKIKKPTKRQQVIMRFFKLGLSVDDLVFRYKKDGKFIESAIRACMLEQERKGKR